MPPLYKTKHHFVIVGAMGAGKTEVLARAVILMAMRFGRNSAIGVVAPTQKRMQIIWQKVVSLLLTEWVINTRVSDGEIELINGCRLQFVSAKIYSQSIGSPIQGYSWAGAGIDEMQDLEDTALADVFLRGRESRDGTYPVISTCTIKDSPNWRNRRAKFESEKTTTLYRMEATANPFVPPEYWESLREVLTPRQYQMRVEAIDARPEDATYPPFLRSLHVRALPTNARNITDKVAGCSMIIGHDPGTINDVSILLRAYEVKGEPSPLWWVLGELTTENETTEWHAVKLLETLRENWGVQFPDLSEPQAIVIADPYGDTEVKPHVTVYKEFIRAGFKIRPAQYSDKTPGKPGSIPKEARIGMVNKLLRNAAGHTRLYFLPDANGVPLAKKLVGALETSERDAAGKAETAKKTRSDLSHWPAALGYGLYPFEKTRLSSPAQYQGG